MLSIVVPFVPLPLFNEKVTKRVRHAFHLTKDKGKAKNNNGMRSEEENGAHSLPVSLSSLFIPFPFNFNGGKNE